MAAALPNLWQRLTYTRFSDLVRGQIDGSLHWRSILAKAQLPSAISCAVEQVVRRTRLWHSEKVAVTEELVSHFQDGLATGASAGNLVEKFGDAATVARLIRRSKRRCRPLLWQAWFWLSRSFVAFVLFYLLMALWYSFGHPTVSTDYKEVLNRRAASVRESDRAWPLYVKAYRILKENTPEGRSSVDELLYGPVVFAHSNQYWDLDGSEREDADKWLENNQEYLSALREAAAMPQMGLKIGTANDYQDDFMELFGSERTHGTPSEQRLYNDAVISILLPHIQAMGHSAAELIADIQRSANAGDGTTALADLRAALGIATHSAETPILVTALAQWSIIRSSALAVERVLANHPDLWSDQQLLEIAHLFAAQNVNLGYHFTGERAMFLDIIQRLYSDDGNGDGRITTEGIHNFEVVIDVALKTRDAGDFFLQDAPDSLREWNVIHIAMPALASFVASRSEVVGKSDELWGLVMEHVNRPLWELTEGSEFQEAFRHIEERPLRYAPIHLMFPEIDSLRMSLERTEGAREGVYIGVALELYRREHGNWPETLDQLTPKYLPEVPVDRINGGPLGYRIVDGKPLVYSLGVDRDDDQGRLPANWESTLRRYVIGPPSNDPTTADDGDWVIWGARGVSDEVPVADEGGDSSDQ